MNVSSTVLGMRDQKEVILHSLVNDAGMELSVINYGCTITKLTAPDRKGVYENIVLGFDTVEEYEAHSPYFGAIIGRHAGRIAGASFELDGETYNLAANNNGNHLHGGLKGFDKIVWDVEVKEEQDQTSLVYTYTSVDGEEGYPGTVRLTVTYTLTENDEVLLTYEGVSDKRTILNMTNHAYFNLSGDLRETTEGHQLTLKSDRYLELNDRLIPTGQAVPVSGTAFDFREGRMIGDGVTSLDPQNVLAGHGYDHPFLLTENGNSEIVLTEKNSGRELVIETNQPAVVLYTGTQLASDFSIRGRQSEKYLGLCLETQGVPDAIHHPEFPTTTLEANDRYVAETKWSFRITKE